MPEECRIDAYIPRPVVSPDLQDPFSITIGDSPFRVVLLSLRWRERRRLAGTRGGERVTPFPCESSPLTRWHGHHVDLFV